MKRFSSLLMTALLLFPLPARSQDDPVSEARAAMTNGEYARAVSILSAALPENPSADTYLYLGISYAHTREWMRAEETLKEGASRYPEDPRFYNELAGVYLAANDLDRARESLQTALSIDPDDKYANDLLATVDMSMGRVEAALEAWNKDDRPVVGDVLQNGHVEFENWIVGQASAFRPGEKLTWAKWKTTETRLIQSGIYSNVGLEIEPTPVADRYTAVIRTSPRRNSREQLAMSFLETLVFQTPTFHLWNMANSGTTLDTAYRFATNRHLAAAGFRASLPFPGLLFFSAAGIFRSERWDTTRPAIPTGIDQRFYFQSTGVRAELKHIPHYRFEFGVGYEYRNRTASGAQPGLQLNNKNTGKMLFEASVLPFAGRYRSRVHGEAFLAREAFLSDIDYSGGAVEWNNRFSDDPGEKTLEISVTAGKSSGELPVDDYFILGVHQVTEYKLRAHDTVTPRGNFGYAPMGTSFTLLNTTFDHRIRRVPFFNALNVPYIDFRWLVFLDAAKTFDRAGVFKEGILLVDIGGGFRVETPTKYFDLTYGRSLRDGTGALIAYVGHRW